MGQMTSPAQVRAVIRNLLTIMDEQHVDHLDRRFLQAIVDRCNQELSRKR